MFIQILTEKYSYAMDLASHKFLGARARKTAAKFLTNPLARNILSLRWTKMGIFDDYLSITLKER
ncbi:hypothetical protein C3F09_05560 [candidate division GN15 bacterium]|uniref:Uncharacterized protein n=1 Tax=candidate division GN15 bacterium TaxID=2072418 RepID=A0A855X6Z3_9BACT|nr:MAG: hypothetical protein C3F09_05560 [candidate division GN15 bacterium]